jgi:hypothetical protein
MRVRAMVFYRWWKPEVDIDVKFGTSGDQFYWWRKPKEPEKTTDLSQVTDKPLLSSISC